MATDTELQKRGIRLAVMLFRTVTLMICHLLVLLLAAGQILLAATYVSILCALVATIYRFLQEVLQEVLQWARQQRDEAIGAALFGATIVTGVGALLGLTAGIGLAQGSPHRRSRWD